MIHRLLANQYRQLAARFAEEGVAAEALSCLTTAVTLDPAARTDDVRRLLRSLADLEMEPQRGPASATVERLVRRKEKLDQMLARERIIASSVETVDSFPPRDPSGESIPDEILRRLVRLEVRLSAIDGRRYEKAHRKLRILLDELLDDLSLSAEERRGLKEPVGRDQIDGDDDDGDEDDGDDSDGDFDDYFSVDFGALSVEHELHNVANDLYQLERYDEAIFCYDLALEINGDLLETYFNRGLAYTRKKRYDTAERDLSKVIDMNPNLAEAWYTRGLIRQYKEEYDEAIDDFEKALEVDKSYHKAEEQLLAARRKRDESRTRRRGKSDDAEESEGRIRDFSPYLTKPDCTLADVGGHREVKRRLRTIAAYLKGDPVLGEWGAELPRGVLLCGRPGVGKTHLARCLAGEAQCPFYAPPTSVFEDMWAGNMQKNLRRLWEQASQHSRAIIFLDEFDSLGSRRTSAKDPDSWYNRMVGCILELMDNLVQRGERLVVIAATNRKANIDAAFLRPGRFTYVIEVDSPSARELAEIWLIHLEAAASRAARVDFLVDPVLEAVLADRQDWLDKAFRFPENDRTGIVRLARLSEDKDLVGDDVREVIRRTIDERVMAAVECGLDLGPITPDDLYRQLEDYDSGLSGDEDDD
jgi:tetratricopeptide (TPR) repeat protein